MLLYGGELPNRGPRVDGCGRCGVAHWCQRSIGLSFSSRIARHYMPQRRFRSELFCTVFGMEISEPAAVWRDAIGSIRVPGDHSRVWRLPGSYPETPLGEVGRPLQATGLS